MTQLWAWIHSGFPTSAGLSEAQRAAFLRHTRESLAADLRHLLPLITVINIAFWFTDEWAFQDIAMVDAFAEGRRWTVLTAMAVWAAVLAAPRWVHTTGALGGAAACFLIARMLGFMGPPSSPWFHFIYSFVLILLIGWTTPLKRAGWVALFTASVMAGYFGVHPQHLNDPMLAVGLLFFAYIMGLSFAIGLYVDDFRLRYWMRQAELEVNNDRLQARVAESTASLRALLSAMDAVQDQERARLARELHDDLGQMLTAQRMIMRSTRQRFAQQPEAIGGKLAQAEAVLEQMSVSLRDVLDGLRPRLLEKLGLAGAVTALARSAEEIHGLECSVELSLPPRELPEALTLVIYRSVQEALTNVAKHAQASRAAVRVQSDDARVWVEVIDDGVGTSGAPREGAMGLLSAQERVHAAGGQLSVTPAPSGGTCFHVTLPLPPSPALPEGPPSPPD